MSHGFDSSELIARAIQIGARLRMFNGGGVDCETYIRVILELSRGHPGGGWCYALASSHALVVGAHFEEDVQRELFGSEGTFALHLQPVRQEFRPSKSRRRLPGKRPVGVRVGNTCVHTFPGWNFHGRC